MKALYYCLNCNSTFTSPKKVLDKHGLDTPPYEKIKTCPFCNCSNYVENFECDLCKEPITGNYIKLSDGTVICSNCYTENKIGE